MDLYEAMSTLRAVRRLKPDPIPDEVLKRILTAATWAPSGGNRQCWRVIVVRESGLKEKLSSLYRPHWVEYTKGYDTLLERLAPEKIEQTKRGLEAGNYLADHLQEAPIICVFCFNPSQMTITDEELSRPSVVGGGSVYPAVQNLLLAARSEGLGCVLTTLLCKEEAAVRELLGIPEHWFTCAHVPLGYPVLGGHGKISRKSIEQMIYVNSFGNSFQADS